MSDQIINVHDDIHLVYEINDISDQDKTDDDEEMVDLHMKKRMRRLAYITALSLLLTGVVLAFSLTIMNISHPKFRIEAINIQKLVINNNNTNTVPSLEMKFDAKVSVKNTNFGEYDFKEGSISFAYGGDEAGEASSEKGKVKPRGVKTMSVTADVEINDSSGLKNDVKLGFLSLASEATLSGKVHLMKVIKIKRTSEMSCTTVIDLARKVVRDLKCK